MLSRYFLSVQQNNVPCVNFMFHIKRLLSKKIVMLQNNVPKLVLNIIKHVHLCFCTSQETVWTTHVIVHFVHRYKAPALPTKSGVSERWRHKSRAGVTELLLYVTTTYCYCRSCRTKRFISPTTDRADSSNIMRSGGLMKGIF